MISERLADCLPWAEGAPQSGYKQRQRNYSRKLLSAGGKHTERSSSVTEECTHPRTLPAPPCTVRWNTSACVHAQRRSQKTHMHGVRAHAKASTPSVACRDETKGRHLTAQRRMWSLVPRSRRFRLGEASTHPVGPGSRALDFYSPSPPHLSGVRW